MNAKSNRKNESQNTVISSHCYWNDSYKKYKQYERKAIMPRRGEPWTLWWIFKLTIWKASRGSSTNKTQLYDPETPPLCMYPPKIKSEIELEMIKVFKFSKHVPSDKCGKATHLSVPQKCHFRKSSIQIPELSRDKII